MDRSHRLLDDFPAMVVVDDTEKTKFVEKNQELSNRSYVNTELSNINMIISNIVKNWSSTEAKDIQRIGLGNIYFGIPQYWMGKSMVSNVDFPLNQSVKIH